MLNISLYTLNKVYLQWILGFSFILEVLLCSCKTNPIIEKSGNKNDKNSIQEFHENKEYILTPGEYEKFRQANVSEVQDFAGIQCLSNLDKYINVDNVKRNRLNTGSGLQDAKYKNLEAGFSAFINKSPFYDLITRIVFCDFIAAVYAIITTIIIRYINKCSSL